MTYIENSSYIKIMIIFHLETFVYLFFISEQLFHQSSLFFLAHLVLFLYLIITHVLKRQYYTFCNWEFGSLNPQQLATFVVKVVKKFSQSDHLFYKFLFLISFFSASRLGMAQFKKLFSQKTIIGKKISINLYTDTGVFGLLSLASHAPQSVSLKFL